MLVKVYIYIYYFFFFLFVMIHVLIALQEQGPDLYPSSVGRAGLTTCMLGQ